MEIQERLKYCRICSNRAYNNYGVVCKFTEDKPQFKNRCPHFIEDSTEREAYEARLFDEKIRNGGFASKNFYSTHERLILLAQHYLPDEFRVKKYKIGLYALTSMFLIMIGVIFLGGGFGGVYSIALALTCFGLAIYTFILNWKSLKVDALELALVNKEGITIAGGDFISWSDVTLIYCNVNLMKQGSYLVLNLLGKSEPLKLSINGSIGGSIILTICEAYRKMN